MKTYNYQKNIRFFNDSDLYKFFRITFIFLVLENF
jgi:hypothetical protein